MPNATTRVIEIPATLGAVNPLVNNNEWNYDTAQNVRCVLEFMADAVASLGMGFTDDTRLGVNLILQSCAEAVRATNT